MKWKDWQSHKPITVIWKTDPYVAKLGTKLYIWKWGDFDVTSTIGAILSNKIIAVYSNGIFEDEKMIYVPYLLVKDAGQLKETVVTAKG